MSTEEHAHNSHDAHDSHADHSGGHGDSHGGGHGDGAPDFPFGEVIPEKNWQENMLMVFCAVVLVGFVWLFLQFMSVPIPAVIAEGGDEVNARHSVHAVEGESNVQVIDAPKAVSGTTNSPDGHAETVTPATPAPSPAGGQSAAPAVQSTPATPAK